ncbi:MAG: NAD(P)/FAD-dependent oxidoreductase [Alphaproteobacteria bacterium]|nr:NAD(P)/FAD-dependent oxidoreductase [Alphaproteobacteria bacterium]
MKVEHAYSTDVVIIGAGPVGLFAIFECGMLKMKCHVVDSLEEIGGQCAALYPEKPIYDIPGFPEVMAGDLITRLEKQAAPFDPVYHLNHQATGLEKRADDRFTVATAKGVEIDCAAVIIAGGAGAFGPNKPPLDGLEDFEGTSVFYMVKRREDFRGKKIAIAGGGDSAVDWALSLAEVAEKVYFIHRRDKFRAAPESVARLKDIAATGKVEMVIPAQLHALHGEAGQLSRIEVSDLDGNKRMLDADTLLPFFGLTPQLGPIAEWGLGVEHYHIPVSQRTSQTNIEGVFAVGDIATYPDKLKLILTGFAEAAQAAHAIHPRVFPGEALHFEYSTSKGVP